MPIDEILKSTRRELTISQETLTRELGISYTTLNRWENNKAKPSRLAMKQLKEFCAQNNVSKIVTKALDEQTRFS